jgi:opacity protein-like surface antigen
MRYILRIFVASVIVSILCLAGVAEPADAQQYTAVRPDGRAGSWEFFLPLIYSNNATIKGDGGSKVDVNDDWAFGLGFGYNITDHLKVDGMFNWAYRSYDATAYDNNGNVSRQYSNYMDSTTLSLNGTYYFLNGKIQPFVSAGIGYTWIDSNIPEGTGSTSCWWDPWYGYVCSSYVPTKTEDDFSYTAGLGVRFDANRQFSMQLGFYRMWIDVSRASTTPEFDNYRLDFIFRM